MLGLRPRAALRAVFVLTGVVAALVSYALGQSLNYGVFAAAGRALWHGAALYPGVSPYFKYGPPFALFFAPLAALPAWLGAAAWGALNFGVAFEGLARALDDDDRLPIAAALAWIGIVLTTDGDQSNLLVVGLVLVAVDGYRRGRVMQPALLLAFGGFIKVFPLVFGVFALGTRRPRAALVSLAVALTAIGVAPIAWLGPRGLVDAYVGWIGMTRGDYGAVASGNFVPWTVGSMLRIGVGLPIASERIELAGATLAIAPAVVATLPRVRERLDAKFAPILASSLLTFVVLFNHRTEYCSFVIAAVAVALWAAHHDTDARFVALFAVAFLALGPAPSSEPVAPFSLDWFVVKRAFHPLRIPGLLALWVLMQRDLWRMLAQRSPLPRLSRF